MRITIDYNKKEEHILKVISAQYLKDFVIKILFSNGSEKVVDFQPFLSKSTNPSIKKYLDERKFSNFKIIDDNLNWNDYDMIFPIWDLYTGKIES